VTHVFTQGQRIKHFTYICEADGYLTKDGHYVRKLTIKCDCGRIRTMTLNYLMRPYVSCSCRVGPTAMYNGQKLSELLETPDIKARIHPSLSYRLIAKRLVIKVDGVHVFDFERAITQPRLCKPSKSNLRKDVVYTKGSSNGSAHSPGLAG
jgi:hypothetical protein